MKTRSIILKTIAPAAAAVFLLAGCGGGDDTGVQARNAENAARSTPAPEEAVVITGNDQMQFSITEFAAAAGSEVTIVFNNIGRMPKEAMGHNLIVLDKDVDVNAFANASMRHANNEYVAPDYENRVIAATKVLGPGESETITFTAPSEPGDYPFVCSFPGHTPAGMRGIMKVK